MLNVHQTGCSFTVCAGYTLRKVQLGAAGVNVTERITINEDSGTVSYNNCPAGGEPGSVERVLAITRPR